MIAIYRTEFPKGSFSLLSPEIKRNGRTEGFRGKNGGEIKKRKRHCPRGATHANGPLLASFLFVTAEARPRRKSLPRMQSGRKTSKKKKERRNNLIEAYLAPGRYIDPSMNTEPHSRTYQHEHSSPRLLESTRREQTDKHTVIITMTHCSLVAHLETQGTV